jgi:hypothetical protein
VVRILVDDDVVAVPVPVITIVIVVFSDVEIISVEPEALTASSSQHPHVARAKAAYETPVGPGMVKVVVDVLTAAIVSDPSAIVVDVRRVGMSFTITEGMRIPIAVLVSTAMVIVVTIRAVLRNVFVMITVSVMIMIPVMIVMILRDHINRKRKQRDDKCDNVLQANLPCLSSASTRAPADYVTRSKYRLAL